MRRRQLLIRPGAIGDCILSLPALEYLAADYTEVWIPSAVVPLFTFAHAAHSLASTGIDLIGVGDLPMPEQLRVRLMSFDAVTSWYGANRPEFKDAIRALGITCTFHAALPASPYLCHAIDFFARQVGAPLGLIPRLQIEPVTPRGTVVIHPFSGGRRKNWPLNLYGALADRLPALVEWTAGPEEALAGAARFDNLRDLAVWLSGARLYIGNDSGITHLAAAVGTPVLALFGPTDPQIWGPRGANVTILRAEPIETLDLETVLDTANRLLLNLKRRSSENTGSTGARSSPYE